ncbi:hypothetical protein M8J77_001845 [Diaphorina citri]|nr:hypothetical protein M8J77_001845 [Diaphorina citri]
MYSGTKRRNSSEYWNTTQDRCVGTERYRNGTTRPLRKEIYLPEPETTRNLPETRNTYQKPETKDSFTTQNSKKLLVKSYILPLLEYCAPLLNNLTLEQSTKLQRAQNCCVRYIYKVRRYEHITPYYNRAQLLRIEPRRKILTLCLLFKVLTSQTPPYLYDLYQFRPTISSRETRSHDLLLHKPPHNTVSFAKSFFISSIDLWNNVPLPILSSRSFLSFKLSLSEAVSNGLFAN